MRDLALALFILGTIPFILMRPYVGLLVWSWIGYMNPHKLCYGFAVTFPWVQLIAIVTILSFLASKEGKKIPLSAVSVLLFLFLAWTGVTTMFAVMPNAAWSKWEEFAKVMIMVFATLALINDRVRMHALVWVIVVSLGFYGVKGGIFTVTHGGVHHVIGPPDTFIADNNALALALCMTIPLMRYLQLHAARKITKIGLGVAIALTGVAVLGTYSRGGLIGLFIVGVALLIKSRRRLAVALAVVVIGTTAYQFMPAQWTQRMETLHEAKETDSGQTRIQSWQFATNVAIHHPLVGGGFDDYQDLSFWTSYAPAGAVQRAIHSIYFRTLGEQGFVGLILFLGLLALSWRNCSRVRKRTRNDPDLKWAFDLASMLQVCLIAFMASGAFLPMPYFDLTFQLLALTAVLFGNVLQAIAKAQQGTPDVAMTAPVGAARTAI